MNLIYWRARHILALAGWDNPLEGVVACGRPEKPHFADYLDQIAGHPKLKGIGRVLHTQPDELGQPTLFAENVRLLEAYGLSFDICVVARQLPIAIRLVRQCPKISFILDPWRQHIQEISKFPNVVCKISGLTAYADPKKWTPGDLRSYVKHAIECFGCDRVLFGSDWPVCTILASCENGLKLSTCRGRGPERKTDESCFTRTRQNLSAGIDVWTDSAEEQKLVGWQGRPSAPVNYRKPFSHV